MRHVAPVSMVLIAGGTRSAATGVQLYGEGGGGEEMRLELLAQSEPATGHGSQSGFGATNFHVQR